MKDKRSNAQQRTSSLSREVIVRTAVEILDESGASGLTFRALAQDLGTGPGAIYWHIANKQELLDSACECVLAGINDPWRHATSPDATIRLVASDLYDALDRHPWVGPHLSANPAHASVLRTLEHVGRCLEDAGVAREQLFDAASAILNYILGVAARMSRDASLLARSATRTEFLDRFASAWEELDPTDFRFLHSISGSLRQHDDRAQFLAGLDFILSGIGVGA